MTIITNTNIRDLVRRYITSRNTLPNDLRNVPIGNWDVSRVTDMSRLFESYDEFNEPLNNWDVSNVTNMEGMFRNCRNFNQPLDNWDVSNVTTMSSMFSGCVNFNQPLNNWNVSNVRLMSSMFLQCQRFNQPLNNWDVSNVTNMSHMFGYCAQFNQPLENWNVSNVRLMPYMFANCTNFNQPLGNWNISHVLDMSNMFEECRSFNQDLSNWDISNVRNMSRMFRGCINFNINPNWQINRQRQRETDIQSIFVNTPLEGQLSRPAARPATANANNFRIGQNVEVFYNNVWRDGIIDNINHYTVLHTRTGETVEEINTDEIRGALHEGIRDTNLIIGSPVQFRQRNQWKNGTITDIFYAVNIGGRGREELIVVVSQSDIQPRGGGTEEARAVRAAAREAARPAANTARPAATANTNVRPRENFQVGDEVDVRGTRADGDWYPGRVYSIINYTVFNQETEIDETVRPNDIREVGEGLVEFRQGDRWLPGTLISTTFFVDMDDANVGLIRVTSRDIRRRAARPAATAARPAATAARPAARPATAATAAAQPRPRGLAFEVHNAFADLDLPKFMAIIRRENNGASNFKDLEHIISYINSSDTALSSEQKTRYTRNIRGSIRENVNTYITDHPEVTDDTLEVIQFVLSQDQKYKDLYIETFENECMGGYSTGNRQSCIKGMFERIYMANKGTIEGLCFEELQSGNTSAASTSAAAASRATSAAATSCKPVYLELYSAFVPGADIDINDIFQKWYNQFSYDAIPEETNPLRNLSVDARKKHFRNFVRQDEIMTRRIWTDREFQRKLEQSIQANNIIFETLNLDAGLGRKRRTVKHIFSSMKRMKKKKNQRKTMKKQRKVTMKHLKRNIRKTKARY